MLQLESVATVTTLLYPADHSVVMLRAMGDPKKTTPAPATTNGSGADPTTAGRLWLSVYKGGNVYGLRPVGRDDEQPPTPWAADLAAAAGGADKAKGKDSKKKDDKAAAAEAAAAATAAAKALVWRATFAAELHDGTRVSARKGPRAHDAKPDGHGARAARAERTRQLRARFACDSAWASDPDATHTLSVLFRSSGTIVLTHTLRSGLIVESTSDGSTKMCYVSIAKIGLPPAALSETCVARPRAASPSEL